MDGYFEHWAKWSTCSVSCGGGTQWRDRVCVPPKHGGAEHCFGPRNETKACETQHCPSKSYHKNEAKRYARQQAFLKDWYIVHK